MNGYYIDDYPYSDSDLYTPEEFEAEKVKLKQQQEREAEWLKSADAFIELFDFSLEILKKINYDYILFESHIIKYLNRNPHMKDDIFKVIMYYLNYRLFYTYSEYIPLFCDPYWDYVYQAHNYEINIMYIYSKVLTDLGFYLRITKFALNNMKKMVDIYKDHSKMLEFYLLIDDIQDLQNSFLYAVIAAQIR
jgi:hypothetical protein